MARLFALTPIATLALISAPAAAQEAYVGASAHAVDLPTSLNTNEGGADLQIGLRSPPIEAFAAIGKPSAYLHAQASLRGDTSVLAAGLSWRIDATDRIYIRPGIGLAVHDDNIPDFKPDGTRWDLGSRVAFEPELAIGYQLSPRYAVEASWVHVSHATLFSEQNPGMDFIGARVVVSLD